MADSSRLPGNTDEEKLANLCGRPHKEQGIWLVSHLVSCDNQFDV